MKAVVRGVKATEGRDGRTAKQKQLHGMTAAVGAKEGSGVKDGERAIRNKHSSRGTPRSDCPNANASMQESVAVSVGTGNLQNSHSGAHADASQRVVEGRKQKRSFFSSLFGWCRSNNSVRR